MIWFFHYAFTDDSKKTFDGMELGDESPLLDMLVEGKGEWHSIHAPPHEYLAMHPYAVAMKHPEGEVYRYQV